MDPALLVLLPLGLDTFALAAAAGLLQLDRGARLRLALLLAVFEGGAPAVGLLLGEPLGERFGSVAGIAAAVALIALGVMALREDDDETSQVRRLVDARGAALLLAGAGVSLDELALGFTLGLLDLPVVPVLVVLAVQSFVLAQLGFALGARLAERLREGAERLAGGVLVLLGLATLVEQLL